MFIATQGPVQATIGHLWKMVALKNIQLIIMLCNLREDSRNKSEQYWPKTIMEKISPSDDLSVYLASEDVILDKAIVRRELEIEFIEHGQAFNHKATQLQVICWPDHSVPEAEIGFKAIEIILSFVDMIRETSPKSPVLVHCSAGIGRTGSFIALYNTYQCLSLQNQYIKNSDRKDLYLNIFNTVRKLREQRFSLVTDVTQYKFLYEFAVEWIRRNAHLDS